MFFKHQNIMDSQKLLSNSIAIVCMLIILDYVLIKNHPHIIDNQKIKSNKKHKSKKSKKVEKFEDEDTQESDDSDKSDESDDNLNDLYE